MPERRPSRAERRRYAERTGRRPVRERPARPFEQEGQTSDSLPGEGGPAPTGSAMLPPVRSRDLAPAAARSTMYLQHRQQQIVKDLRGLAASWVIVIALFVAVVVYVNVL